MTKSEVIQNQRTKIAVMKLTEDQSNVVDGLGWIGGHQQVMLSLCKTFSFFSRLQRLALAVIIVSVYEAKV